VSNLITQSDLVNVIRSLKGKGATFFSFQTVTEAQASQAKSAEKVLKFSYVNGLLEWNYENSVNNQLKREENPNASTFQAKPRKWGKHETLSLVWHKGEPFLHVKVEKALEKPRYFFQGKEVSKEEIGHLLKESAPSATQAEVGIEKEVIPRDYSFSSIREIRLDGKVLVLDHSVKAVQPEGF